MADEKKTINDFGFDPNGLEPNLKKILEYLLEKVPEPTPDPPEDPV